jgi:hypothetical protein
MTMSSPLADCVDVRRLDAASGSGGTVGRAGRPARVGPLAMGREVKTICPAMKSEVSTMHKLRSSSLLSTQFARQAARIATAVILAHIGLAGTARAKPFEDYIKPMPIVSPLSSASWGTAALPRDLSNGIESAMGAGVHPQWYYWDGQIIKATDGKYHMFMSTFDANSNFGTAWQGSDAYHAISQTNVLGPYLRQDYVYSTGGSSPHKGHNVSAVELPDGTYAVIVSEIVPFQIFKSSSLDGPWTGCSPQSDIGASNISMFPRHDGKYQIVERNGRIAIADTLCGHYVKQTPTCAYTQNPTDAQGNPVSGTIYAKRTSIPGVSNPSYLWQEDPHIWRSGGTYHVIYSGSGDRVGWHVYSPDGLSWKDNGYAWSPRDYQKIFCYEGSTTCNAWYKMERPGVVLEDGHPTHITWAVSDVDKDNQVLPGTNHGTKVVVVPFDGVAFDNDFGVGGSSGTGGSGGGGASGTGGVSGSGGRDGGMGGSGSGGSSGTGGVSGSGGRDGGMGGSGSGGLSGTGGTTAAGGSSGTGGLGGRGSGGATGPDGTTSAGGATGGNVGAGGTTATNSGGVSGAGGSASGGKTGNSGGSGAGSGGNSGGNSGSSGSTSTSGGGSSPGCACTIRGREQTRGGGVLLVLGFLLLSAVRRRRS